MKKIFNFRPLFLVFISFFFGAYFSVRILFAGITIKIILALIILVAICLAFLKVPFFKLRKLPILIVCFSLIFGFSYSAIKINFYNKNQINATIEVSGVVSDKIVPKNGYTIYILKNVSSEEAKLNGKMQLVCFDSPTQEITPGDKVTFTANVSSQKILSSENLVNSKIEKTNCKYFASVEASEVFVQAGDPNFFEKIRLTSRENILKHTKSDEIGNLIYSVIFGDKTFLSPDIYKLFNNSGTVHLLAVSGLHVGFIALLLLLILKACKAKKLVKFTLISIFLVFYNILCGFSASIVRASLMTELLLTSSLLGERNDPLTSLSIAGILILLVKPLQAFDFGFQLSFGSVLGIITLASVIERKLIQIKMPKVLAAGLSISASVSIGTLPFLVLSNKSFALVGLISNVVIIPIFGIVYMACFLIFLLTLIIKPLGVLFIVGEAGFKIILWLTKVFGFFSGIKIVKIGIAILLIYPLMFIVSDFAFLKQFTKRACAFALAAVLMFSFGLVLIPPKVKSSASKLENDAVVVCSKNREVLLISETFDDYEIENALKFLEQRRLLGYLKGILITGDAKDEKQVFEFAAKNKNINIFIGRNSFIDENEINKHKNLFVLEKIFMIDSFDIVVIEDGGRVLAVQVEVDGKKVLCLNKVYAREIEFLNIAVDRVDVVFCNDFFKNYQKIRFGFKNFCAKRNFSQNNEQISFTNANKNYTIKL